MIKLGRDSPEGFLVVLPQMDERACSPPVGSMALYLTVLERGIPLSLHPFF